MIRSKKHGAEDFILAGYSMGGAIVMNFLKQSDLSQKVRGVILEAPMLDLSATVDLGARMQGIPRVLTALFTSVFSALSYFRTGTGGEL